MSRCSAAAGVGRVRAPLAARARPVVLATVQGMMVSLSLTWCPRAQAAGLGLGRDVIKHRLKYIRTFAARANLIVRRHSTLTHTYTHTHTHHAESRAEGDHTRADCPAQWGGRGGAGRTQNAQAGACPASLSTGSSSFSHAAQCWLQIQSRSICLDSALGARRRRLVCRLI